MGALTVAHWAGHVTNGPRAIMHVDLDCFFVSVERVLDPKLAQRPVVVGGSADARGVVSSASREARAAGVHSGMPTAVARRLCPDAVFLAGRGRLYGRAAAAAHRVMREFSPKVERASIDEAYLDVTDAVAAGEASFALASSIQQALQDRLGLPASVGIASNKLVAKVACQQAKPAGILEVWTGYEEAFLAPLPVGDLPGIGPVLAERLRLFGLRTVGDLARVDRRLLEAMFGIMGRHVADKARGIGEDEIDTDEQPRSIGHEQTFARDVRDAPRLFEALYALAKTVGERLRAQGLKGRTVSLKLRTGDFRTLTRSRTLADATDCASEIAGVACFLLREAHAAGSPVRLVGITVANLTDAPVQARLFPDGKATHDAAQDEPQAPDTGGGPAARRVVLTWRSLLPARGRN